MAYSSDTERSDNKIKTSNYLKYYPSSVDNSSIQKLIFHVESTNTAYIRNDMPTYTNYCYNFF